MRSTVLPGAPPFRDESDGLADIEPHNFVHMADEDVTKHVVALHR